jgi:hypothetical protein
MFSALLALYAGTWNCAKPTDRSGYFTTLAVTQATGDRLEFTSRGVGASRDRGLLFAIAPSGGDMWVLRSADYPYPLTGALSNGTIVFAPPAPSPKRFELALTNHDQTLSYVDYTKYGFEIDRQYRTTTCSRVIAP